MMGFYEKFKSIINTVIAVIVLGLILVLMFKYQYNKGVKDGKNDPATKVEAINTKTADVRKNIEKAVVIIETKYRDRTVEIDNAEEANKDPEVADPVLKEKFEDPEQGITDEMFASLNQARAETEK